MKASEVLRLIEPAIAQPVETWDGYSPRHIPFAIYDEHDVFYLNHPNPPQQRPEQLAAATAMDINGVKTATIPAEQCPTPESIMPLVYHEGFHVYQDTAFRIEYTFDFFKALAYYPEMNAEYRAICRLEVELLNRPEKPLDLLAALAKRRYAILERLPDVLPFEKRLERVEGTAAWVEARARGTMSAVEPHYGWARQYTTGAALCRAIESVPNWQKRVENGESPSEILMATFPEGDLSAYDLDSFLKSAQTEIDGLLAEVRPLIETLESGLVIEIPAGGYRAFSPMSMRSLGAGRMLHTKFLKLFLPGGKIEIDGAALEDHNRGEVRFSANAWTFEDGTLTVSGNGVNLHLKGVEQTADRRFKVM